MFLLLAVMEFSAVLNRLMMRQDLLQETVDELAAAIFQGTLDPIELSAVLTALRTKEETPTEIAALARAMRQAAERILVEGPLLDTCGTGGDGAHTINISTTTAFVLAGAGIRVAKHGNRSISSRSGGMDVLESLGVKIELSPAQIKTCIEQVGISFLFAKNHHPAMKHVMPVRKKLGVRTVFNILGPLTNPANADYQIMGVFAPEYVEIIAQVLKELGLKRALVFHGSGLDELALHGPTQCAELNEGSIQTFEIRPEDAGLQTAPLSELQGGEPTENAQVLEQTLRGELRGPKRDVILLNAAAGLYVMEQVDNLKDGVKRAGEIIDQGLALQKLEALREMT